MIQVFQIDRERLDQTASSNIWQCAGCCFPFPSLIEQSVADRQSEERWRRLLLGATKKAARKSLPFVLHAILGVALVSLFLLFFLLCSREKRAAHMGETGPECLRQSPPHLSISDFCLSFARSRRGKLGPCAHLRLMLEQMMMIDWPCYHPAR